MINSVRENTKLYFHNFLGMKPKFYSTETIKGNHQELTTDIESTLDQLSYDGDSYNVENIKAMVNWFTHFGFNDNRRESLVQ